MPKLQQLPIANSSFTSIRNLEQIYVDKTALIYELARFNTSQYFLARPRRFGKSLLVSTLESLFKDGLKMFHGLAIEKLWDESRTYKVLRLDFSGIPCSSREIFAKAAVRKFFLCAADAGLLDEFCAPGDFHSISYLIDAICRRCGENPFVLLVDEYDAPLAANADSPEKLAGIRLSLGYFYDAVKANSGSFRLVFITGTAGFGELVRMVRSSAVVDL